MSQEGVDSIVVVTKNNKSHVAMYEPTHVDVQFNAIGGPTAPHVSWKTEPQLD